MYLSAIRTLVLYLVIVLGVRLMGKRHLGELQPSELVVTILISNIATLPIEEVNVPILAGILPILLLVCFEVVVSFFSMKSRKVRRLFSGNAIPVIRDGQIDQKSLSDLRFSVDDLMEELHQSGIFDPSEVDYAVVETNGQLSVYPKFSSRPLTPQALGIAPPGGDSLPPQVLVSNGQIYEENLRLCGHDHAWLNNQLAQRGFTLQQIYLMTGDRSNHVCLVPKGERQ